MTKETFTAFLASLEEVAANLDDIPDDMLPELLALAQQFSYLVQTETDERMGTYTEERHPVQEYYDDESRSFIS